MLSEMMNMSDTDLSEIRNPNTSTTSSGGGGYQSKTGGYQNSGGGYQNSGGGYQKKQYGGGNFKRKEEVIEEPYSPVSFFIDRDFPTEVKQRLISIASKLINKGHIVRYNADDPEVHSMLSEMGGAKVEAYVPFKGFNEVNTKHYWNTKTSKHMAETNFSGYEKVPDIVKSMLARNIRMIFGDKNNSITKCLVTWSPDGASRSMEVTKDTGRASFIIKVAAKHNYPVINLGREGAESIIDKAFDLLE